MSRPFPVATALISLALAACAGAPVPEPPPTPRHIPVCWGFGCAQRAAVSLSDAEWQRVRAHFSPTARDAATERAQLARAVGELERVVGPRTGTERDRGGTFVGPYEGEQMDCIDESTNTTGYLRLFAAQHLLRWHTVGETATRGYLLFGWPHTTATIREEASGAEYAVDSWFFHNGADAVVVPLKQWRAGWSPFAVR